MGTRLYGIEVSGRLTRVTCLLLVAAVMVSVGVSVGVLVSSKNDKDELQPSTSVTEEEIEEVIKDDLSHREEVIEEVMAQAASAKKDEQFVYLMNLLKS